jgi:hypothetical protein
MGSRSRWSLRLFRVVNNADKLKYTLMFPFDVAGDAFRFRTWFACRSTYGQTFGLHPKTIVA